MIIPNMHFGPIVTKSGHPTPEFMGIMSQLIEQLQQNLSNEGYKVPQQPTDTINALNTSASEGALLYDSATKALKINIDGIFKTIQVV